MDTALVWHLHRYRELRENDMWVNYSAAIRTEYWNEREAADAQFRLGQLKYQGSIRAYLTEFRALNNFAHATGEALREKVDLAMPDAVLDIRFAHYLEDFADDEGFLQATHQAGLQVEKKKALKVAKEAMRTGPVLAKDGKKDDRHRDGRRKEETQPPKREETRRNEACPPRDGWGTLGATLKVVPQNEVDVHKKDRDSCWRCRKPDHKTYDCFSFQTAQGTTLPPAPWKVAAVTTATPTTGKRTQADEPESVPATKQQKVAAVEEMVTDLPLWAESEESDF